VTLAVAIAVERLRRARVRVVVDPAGRFAHALIPARYTRLSELAERAGFVPAPMRLRPGAPVPWLYRPEHGTEHPTG
jgi:hypothetical protein